MTGRTPTQAERSAHEMLCRMYRRDLDGHHELGLPLPADHQQLTEALRQLDRQVGMDSFANDITSPAGEGVHRWIFWNGAGREPLTQADVTAGSALADRLVTDAARRQIPREPLYVDQTRSRLRLHDEGPRGVVPRG